MPSGDPSGNSILLPFAVKGVFPALKNDDTFTYPFRLELKEATKILIEPIISIRLINKYFVMSLNCENYIAYTMIKIYLLLLSFINNTKIIKSIKY